MRTCQYHTIKMIWAHFLYLAWSKLRLCSAKHRAGYFNNLACDWLSIVWAYSEKEAENRPRPRAFIQGFKENVCKHIHSCKPNALYLQVVKTERILHILLNQYDNSFDDMANVFCKAPKLQIRLWHFGFTEFRNIHFCCKDRWMYISKQLVPVML